MLGLINKCWILRSSIIKWTLLPYYRKRVLKVAVISGIMQSSATLLKYCLSAPELARIANEAESMVGMQNTTRTEHHCLNSSTVKRQEGAIEKLHKVLAQCDIFKSKETHPSCQYDN
jgi:hypothetical protein